jgi:hydrogenase maturation protease
MTTVHREPAARTLVIGVGNQDRGDDAVGLLVARRVHALSGGGCDVVECSGSMTSLLDIWSQADRVLLVDAVQGAHPGRWHRVGATLAEATMSTSASSHGFGVGEVIALARALDALPESLVVYAVEGSDFRRGAEPDDSMRAAVDEVAARVLTEATAAGQPDALPLSQSSGSTPKVPKPLYTLRATGSTCSTAVGTETLPRTGENVAVACRDSLTLPVA